ncbi:MULTISPECIES: TSUP family transporter [unclassified Bartonella]|uniref:TSUP family transporter n=1 Tax=unclassified Bartonella TaxID=2645622 RepID=UPI0021C99FD6|nr:MULTISPECIES: TSUP family transporter [unclassified Bartonella]UXM96244.1 TSUP family transporter [Bartonella sp. HY329]UXN02309.1 TSUP family transporter [Bartonella sp. HY406]UXN05205.1 TSUP family transporter [Bartonella sp. HY761]UXN10568.1 TSUP family transporter [Bartonella sp. HY328]
MIDFLLDPTTLMLIAAALIAGIIDSIAGGGGLITVPALYLGLGGSPVAALGTNKLQSLFGSLSATIAYARAGHVDLKSQGWEALLAFAGGLLGALLATKLPKEVLTAFLPILLVSVALYFALKPNIGDVDRTRRMGQFLFTMTIPPLIGFYDGVFGPGTGSFFMLAFVSLAGFGMLKATAHTKLLNFSSNIGGFAAFAAVGVVNWKIGLVMGVAQFIGAQIGARLTMKIGTKLIKPLLVIICTILAIKLMLEPDNPLNHFIRSVFNPS